MDIAKIAAPSHSGRLMVPPVCPGYRRMITFCCLTSASIRAVQDTATACWCINRRDTVVKSAFTLLFVVL